MRRRDVSPEELAKIINLRQIDTSWLKIQHDTGIPRRIAKRAYEDWSRSQSREELKAARKDVAAEEFRNHLGSLVKLAEAFANALDIPEPTHPPISAEDFLSISLWQHDIAGEYGVYGPSKVGLGLDIHGPETWNRLRQNQILLKSLQCHTQEKVDWQMFEEWKKMWDECIRAQDILRRETRRMLLDTLNQESGLTDRIVKASGEKDTVERMVTGVLHVVWQGILAGGPDQSPSVEVTMRGDRAIDVVFDEDQPGLSVTFTEANSAKEVRDRCIWVAKNLGIVKKGDMIKLADNVHRMREIIDKLTEMLNPLMLRPQILRTRCDLCPA